MANKRQCVGCGKLFEQTHGLQKYCCHECMVQHHRKADRTAYRESVKVGLDAKETERRRKPAVSIEQKLAEARRMGLTYGELSTYEQTGMLPARLQDKFLQKDVDRR